ncbi:MAG: phage replication protein, partial [bacterium]
LKLKPDDALTKTIISAISNQNLASREQQFIPHPASWLNAQRWEDEIKVANTTSFPFGRRIL